MLEEFNPLSRNPQATATVSITLDLYSHVLPDMQKEATAAMERLLSGE